MNKLQLLQQQYETLQEHQQRLFDKAAQYYSFFVQADTESSKVTLELSALEEEISKLEEQEYIPSGTQLDLFEDTK